MWYESKQTRHLPSSVYTNPALLFFISHISDLLTLSLKVYKMNFDNAAFKHRMPQQKTAPGYEKLPMKRGIFFDMFPFSVIFRRDMTMYWIGDGLKEVFSDLQGKKVNEEFTLVRPMLEFSWDNVSELEGWRIDPKQHKSNNQQLKDEAFKKKMFMHSFHALGICVLKRCFVGVCSFRSTPTSTMCLNCCLRLWWRANRRSTSLNSTKKNQRRKRRVKNLKKKSEVQCLFCIG